MKRLLLLLPVLVLLVSCSSTRPRFMFFENVAIDQNTGITWASNANLPGKQLAAAGEKGVQDYLKRLNTTFYAGYDDWRLPSKAELERLIEYARLLGYSEANHDTWPYKRLRQLGFIDVRNDRYWSGSRSAPGELYSIDMTNGKASSSPEEGLLFLWPVRGVER